MSYIVKAKPREGFKGFWRDGKFWTNEGIEVEEVSEAVLNEPMLIVEEVDDSGIKDVIPIPNAEKPKAKTVSRRTNRTK